MFYASTTTTTTIANPNAAPTQPQLRSNESLTPGQAQLECHRVDPNAHDVSWWAGSGFVGRRLAFGVELDEQPVWVFEFNERAEVPFEDRRVFDAAPVEIHRPVHEVVGVSHTQRDRRKAA
jgi:hypothetical protein